MKNIKETEDFDLFVRESFRDASAEPSPAVWEAIEAKLPPVAAPARAFRPAWAVLVAAAAIAAAVFIPQNTGRTDTEGIGRLALAAPSALVEEGFIPSPRPLLALRSEGASIKAQIIEKEALTPADGNSINTAAQENRQAGAVAEGISGSENAAAETDADKSASAGQATTNGKESSAADIFDAMQAEDAAASAKRARRIAAYIGGGIGGNETGSRPAAYAAGSKPGYIENDIIETGASNYGIPVSLGAGVRFALSDRLYLGTGIDYSLLSRSFAGAYTEPGSLVPVTGDIYHEMQYLGVPLSLSYNILKTRGLRFYAMALAQADWCVGNTYSIRANSKKVSEKVPGAQFSAGFGMGVEFKINDFLGIYLDPSARYYFDAGHPRSVRTETPFMANFNVGLRFNFR